MLSLQCVPNPAVDHTVLKFENNKVGAVEIIVWNQAGQQVKAYSATKTNSEFVFPLEISTWPSGTYQVQSRIGTILYEGAFIKN